ncbi:MAG: hypothetical protein ABIF77_08285 [bacterium]
MTYLPTFEQIHTSAFARFCRSHDLDADAAVNHRPFHTFSWCSEREMAFVALLTALGYRGKIEQAGIHTWSAFWCEFLDVAGRTHSILATISPEYSDSAWRDSITDSNPSARQQRRRREGRRRIRVSDRDS